MATTFLKKIANLEAANRSSSFGLRLSNRMLYTWKKSSISTKKSSSVVVKKPVLIVARDRCEQDIWSYVVTVSSSGGRINFNNTCKTLSPISWNSWSLDRCTFALIGSTLYCVGGCKIRNCPSSYAYVTDLGLGCCTKNEWNGIGEMHSERLDAQEVVIDEKLYVFGGIDLPHYGGGGGGGGTPWAEVYDPKQKFWTALTEPPLYLSNIDLFVAYDQYFSSSSSKEKKMIVVGGHYPLLRHWVLLAYDIINDTWEIINDKFWFLRSATQPVLYDNKLYWLGDNKVFVYDLNLKKMFDYFDSDLLECGVGPAGLSYKPTLIHIVGDEFGVIWIGSDISNLNNKHLLICCTTIRISISIDEKGSIDSIKGRSLFARCYPIDQFVCSMVGRLLL